MRPSYRTKISACWTAAASAFLSAPAAEIGHFSPGVPNIRDFIMPEPGFYGVMYSYGYTSDRLNDGAGNEIKAVTIRPGMGPGVTLGVDVDVDVYAVSPAFIWVSPWKVLGAKYGAYLAPTLGNTTVGASLVSQTGSGRSAEDSQFGLGDMYVQPLWLDWSMPHWDLAFAYGFYAPVGQYDTQSLTLPVVGPLTVEATDNIGLGFWTHQLQGTVSWYPWVDRRLAVVTALTYEIHGEKDDFDLKPGQNLTLNWGLSQYLPLRKDQKLLLEAGPAGYSSWQITDDSGAAAGSAPTRDEVHAVGGQVGLSYLPWNASLNFHYFYEFASLDRFQGQSVGLNFAIKF